MTTQLWTLILFSAVLHASWNFGAKKVSGNLGVIWLGMAFASLAILPWALRDLWRATLSFEACWRMGLTGFFNAIYFVVLGLAYRTGDLSFVYPIARGSGVAAGAVAGRRLLHESVSRLGALGITSVCLGTVVLSFHRGFRQRARGDLGLAIGVGLILGVSALNDKCAMALLPPGLYLFAMCFLSWLMLIPYMWVAKREQTLESWRELKRYGALIGVGSALSYGLVLIAYQMGPMSYILPARESAVIVGAGLGIVLLHEPFTVRKGIGIATIATGLVLLRLG